MVQSCRSRVVAFIFSAVLGSWAVADVLNSPEEVKSHAERIRLVLEELDIEVSTEELIALLGADKGATDVMRIVECMRSQGVIPELTLPTDAEITSATRPMLIRTTDSRWYSFRSSQDGSLRPALPSGDTKAKIPFEGFKLTWSGFAIMLSRLPPGETMPKPAQVRFESEEVDFGKAVRGKTVEARFAFENVGDQPLRLRNAAPDKKALQIRAVPERLEYAPGSSGELTVTYDTGYGGGPVSIAADFMTNDPQRIFVSLKLKGEVVDPVSAELSEVEFGPITAGATATKTVQLKSFDGSDFSVAKASADQPFVTVSVREGEPASGSKIALEVTVDSSGMDSGMFEARCTVGLSPAEMGPVSFRVLGSVAAPDVVE